MIKIKESIEVDSSIQLQFQRQNTPLESLFREFIDNSYDSYNNPENKQKLNAIGIDKCYVKITIDESKIIIEDKAFGMNHEAFRRALQLSRKSSNYHKDSLGQFGMGLKYAAISLGDEYKIETTALGSNEKYTAVINRELLESNSKTVENIVDDNYDKEAHFTKITISRLLTKMNYNVQQTLMKDLGRIYHKFIDNNDLEIVFAPNDHVKYSEPELWINDDNSEYSEDFEDTFEFSGQKYTYYGWVGILRVGDTKNSGFAGFSLHHKNRIIKTNYRNENLLGRANGFSYQRIVGDINLNDFPVDFNKSDFSWNNGLEEAFIDSLNRNIVFSNMKKTANALRKRKSNEIPKKEDLVNLNKKQEKLFSGLSRSKKTNNQVMETRDDAPAIYRDENTAPLIVEYESIKYTFFVEYIEELDSTKKWLSINVIDPEKYEYSVKINNNFKLFEKIKKSDREIVQNFVLLITLSQISSVRSGFKDSYKFVNKMNEIIKLLEE